MTTKTKQTELQSLAARMRTFVVSAGSLILIFSLVLWALAEYPRWERYFDWVVVGAG